jgi:hypothetical protein
VGRWRKFSDGTLIQTINKTFTFTTATAYGNLYYGPDHTINLPVNFIDTNYSVSPGFTTQGIGACQIQTKNVGSIVMRPINGNGGTGFSVTYSIVAVGRWIL